MTQASDLHECLLEQRNAVSNGEATRTQQAHSVPTLEENMAWHPMYAGVCVCRGPSQLQSESAGLGGHVPGPVT